MVLGSLTMTLVMIPMNLIFTVHAFGVPKDVVMAYAAGHHPHLT